MKQKTEGNDWFADSLMNLIVDYYTEVPFRPYGSGATRESLLPVLEDLDLGGIVIYAKGHSGTTSFASALGSAHPQLGQDMPALLREVTREAGTRLILYYSGLLDGIAGERHPEWRMQTREGQPLTMFREFTDLFTAHAICPQSPYFDEWVKVHLDEMIVPYDVDAIWVDGDWPGPCYCPRCEARFRAESGFTGPMPARELLTPEGIAWTRTWSQITHEWRTRFRDYVKQLKPSCLYSAGNISTRSEFNGLFDWRSGDWFSPNNHRLHMSLAMRRYATLGLPYDGYVCDTVFVHTRRDLRSRTKPLDRILQEGATILANGGKWGYWTYPMPNGALVPSKMRQARDAAAFARERQDLCRDTESVPWTAILHAEPSSNMEFTSDGAGKALVALHRSPLLIDEMQLADDMPYEMIVAAEQTVLEPQTARQLERFVRRGGILLTSGASAHSPEMQELLGLRLSTPGEVNDGHVFLANGEPAGVYAPWDRFDLLDAEELYPLYLSWDHDNPDDWRILPNYPITGMVDEENPQAAGFPAATIRRLGEGTAVHLATDFFSVYWRYGNPDMLAWLRQILERVQPGPLLQTDAPSFVEFSLRHRQDTLLVHCVNGNPGRDISHVNSDDYWVDEIPAIGPINVKLRTGQAPEEVVLEPGNQPLAHSFADGVLAIELPRLEIHACIVVRPWQQNEEQQDAEE